MRRAAGTIERAALAGMGLGVALMLQPWWDGGYRVGFFVTLASTSCQIVAAHVPGRRA